jgi:hypothetical protein
MTAPNPWPQVLNAPVPVLKVAYQTRQFNVLSPAGIGTGDSSILQALANPEASGLTALNAVNPLEESAEWLATHFGPLSGSGGMKYGQIVPEPEMDKPVQV